MRSGVVFQTKSDTEVVLAGLIHWGDVFLQKMNGIFAFAFFDQNSESLLLGRDRLGVKPLYYRIYDNVFEFASELKAFNKSTTPLDKAAVATYIQYLWLPGEKTLYTDINRLLPGHLMRVSLRQPHELAVHKYFDDRPPVKQGVSLKKSVQDLDQLLTQTINRQLLADVPVGFFLSGGLDSSLIVAKARQLYPDRDFICYTVNTSTFSKDEGFSDDLSFAKRVAEHLDVTLRVVELPQIADQIDDFILELDEPQADPAAYYVRAIAEQARLDGIKVLVGGTGADDLFTGYKRHILSSNFDSLRFVPPSLARLLARLVFNINYRSPVMRRIRRLLYILSHSPKERMHALFHWISLSDITPLLNFPIDKRSIGDEYLSEVDHEWQNQSPLDRILNIERRTFLVDHNLNYTDKMGMACGVEIRVPYLDNDILNFAMSLPDDLRVRAGEMKFILKKVAEDYLPHDIIYRDKAGFGGPLGYWFRHELKAKIDSFLKEVEQDQTIFKYDQLKNIITINSEGKKDLSYAILAMYSLHQYYKASKV